MMAQDFVLGQLRPKNLKYLKLIWLLLQSLVVDWSMQRNLEEGKMVQQIFWRVGQEMLEVLEVEELKLQSFVEMLQRN